MNERRTTMEGSGLSASDVLALTRGNDDGMFGGVGRFYFIVYFLTCN